MKLLLINFFSIFFGFFILRADTLVIEFAEEVYFEIDDAEFLKAISENYSENQIFHSPDEAIGYSKTSKLRLVLIARFANLIDCDELKTIISRWKIENEIDVESVVDEYGRTPLHYAAAFSDICAIRVLVSIGHDANTMDDFSRVPLAYSSDPNSFLAILSVGGNYLIKDNNGFCPMDFLFLKAPEGMEWDAVRKVVYSDMRELVVGDWPEYSGLSFNPLERLRSREEEAAGKVQGGTPKTRPAAENGSDAKSKD